jgi:hypothetical protein
LGTPRNAAHIAPPACRHPVPTEKKQQTTRCIGTSPRLHGWPEEIPQHNDSTLQEGYEPQIYSRKQRLSPP